MPGRRELPPHKEHHDDGDTSVELRTKRSCVMAPHHHHEHSSDNTTLCWLSHRRPTPGPLAKVFGGLGMGRGQQQQPMQQGTAVMDHQHDEEEEAAILRSRSLDYQVGGAAASRAMMAMQQPRSADTWWHGGLNLHSSPLATLYQR